MIIHRERLVRLLNEGFDHWLSGRKLPNIRTRFWQFYVPWEKIGTHTRVIRSIDPEQSWKESPAWVWMWMSQESKWVSECGRKKSTIKPSSPPSTKIWSTFCLGMDACRQASHVPETRKRGIPRGHFNPNPRPKLGPFSRKWFTSFQNKRLSSFKTKSTSLFYNSLHSTWTWITVAMTKEKDLFHKIQEIEARGPTSFLSLRNPIFVELSWNWQLDAKLAWRQKKRGFHIRVLKMGWLVGCLPKQRVRLACALYVCD